MNKPLFEIVHQSKKSLARVGRIHTAHGVIETPNFVPVATNATIKAVEPTMLESLGAQLIFCNTYHLLLHPGPEIVAQAGGLHSFMHRTTPIITDSGGFQVFSLAYGGVHDELKSRGQKKNAGSVIKVSEEGVLFRSYRDGQSLLLTPESSVQAQKMLGADIIIPLDELPPYHINAHDLKRSLERTHRWEARSLAEHAKDRKHQVMFAVVHGGVDPAFRLQSVRFLASAGFDGFAIGGSLGKNREEMVTMLTSLMPEVPTDAPRHLLGIGDIPSLDACVPLGLDTFDSSHPTRCARHGLLLSWKGDIKIMQSCYKDLFRPIDETCTCPTCQNYTLAYIHHLFKAHEITGLMLASVHNIHYMMERMRWYRQQILEDRI